MPQDQDDIKGAVAMKQAPTKADSVKRINRYLERLSKSRQLDQERIHAFDLGEASEAELLASDIRALFPPTAPVEASGSEREGMQAVGFSVGLYSTHGSPAGTWGYTSSLTQQSAKGYRTEQAAWDAASEVFEREHVAASRFLAALRPQPSGETREQAVMVCPKCDGEGHYADGVDEAACSEQCTRCDGNGWIVDLVLLSARPLALGGQHSGGEDAAWTWLNGHVECDPADRDYSADEMVDAFMAGAGRYDIWAKALERIAGEHQHRSGYCQTDITVEPALTAEEAQTVARDALSTTPARAEAQDEGAAEREAMEAVMASVDPATWPGLSAEHRADLGRFAKPASAHPSPTPAAQDDYRVRDV